MCTRLSETTTIVGVYVYDIRAEQGCVRAVAW